MKVDYFLKKGFEIRDIQGKSLNKFILQEAKGRIKPVPWEAINGRFTLENVNVKYILEEKHIIETKDTWRNFIWKTVSQLSIFSRGEVVFEIVRGKFLRTNELGGCTRL